MKRLLSSRIKRGPLSDQFITWFVRFQAGSVKTEFSVNKPFSTKAFRVRKDFSTNQTKYCHTSGVKKKEKKKKQSFRYA